MGRSDKKFWIPGDTSGKSAPMDKRAIDEVFSLVYEELRRLASFVRRNDHGATLNSTALVHEAWLKLKDSRNLAGFSAPHFKAVAANAMRQVLVDAARRRNSQKRGGGEQLQFVTLDESAGQRNATSVELLALHAALDRLGELNPRQAAMVECRFFTGLSVEETAGVLGVSPSVVERDWRAAKAWLTVEMRAGDG
jgi:RNA polymerase sigma factor (TIGR02999 family)